MASHYFNISLTKKNLQSLIAYCSETHELFFFNFSATVASLISLTCYSICLLEYFPAQKLHVSSSCIWQTENNRSLVVAVMLMGFTNLIK